MGFDIQCIPNLESVPREYFCPVCKFLINPKEALQSGCGHLYCKPCLAYVASTTMACPYDDDLVTEGDSKPLAVSNKELARTIDKTEVNCLYKDSGCNWLGSLSASTSHCSRCPFGTCFLLCTWCGTLTEHRQWQEHVQVCREMHNRQVDAYIEATAAMATSQANAQGHGVAAATLTQKQWYQQLYYGNGYYMHQRPLHLPSLAPQHHVNGQPAVHYVAQTHSQMQAQPQLQSQNSVMPQPHAVSPSAPHLGAASLSQAYPLVPPHPQHPSQTFSASRGLPDLQAQTHFQTTPLSQAPYLQNAQVPQQKIDPQPSQIYQIQAPPNIMFMSHQVGTQTSQVQNHFPQNVLHVHPQKHPHTLQVNQPTTPVIGFQPPQMNHHSASTSEVGSGQASPSLPAVKEADIQKTQSQVSQASWGQDNVPPNYIFWKQGIEEILDGSEARSTADSTNAGVNRDVTIKSDHENKGKGIDACIESLHRSSIIEEGNERKSGFLGKQVIEEHVGNGQKNLGKSLLVEKKGTGSGPSLNGTPVLDPVSLEQDVLRHLNILHQQYLMTARLHGGDVERSGAYPSGSLDRGFDQRSPDRPHEKHELDFELKPASRFSQPAIDLEERQFRRSSRSPISDHLGMYSHGSGPLDHELGGTRADTTDTEGRYRFGSLNGELEGHGNLQREKVQDADVNGPADNNGFWPRDAGLRSTHTLQGLSGDGGSFPGDLGSFPNSRKMIIGTIEVDLAFSDPVLPREFNVYGRRRDPATYKET